LEKRVVYHRTARAEATRAASQASLLKAAARLFAERGYEATTMQDIVRAAGTSIGNAYFYFENKEALLRSLVHASSTDMFDEAEQHTAHLTGPERVGAIIAFNTMNFLTTHRNMLRMLTADSRLAVVQALGDLAVQRWVPVLAGALPDRAPSELPAIAAAIWGTNRSIVERIARGTLDLSLRAAVTFMVRWTARALGVSATRTDRIVASAWRLASRSARATGTRS
jgi:AcrR family transcriptional regulator